MAKRHGKYKISKKEAALIAVDAGSYDTGPITVSGTLLASGLITGQAGLALDNLTIADTSGNAVFGGTLRVNGNCAFFNTAPVAQQAAVADITDNSGGVASDTLAAITGGGNDCEDATKNAIASLAAKVDGLSLALRNLGLIA